MNNFYDKHDPNQYEKDHSRRLDFLVEDLELDEIREKRLVDFGGGKGFLLNRLHESNYKQVFDGDKIEPFEGISFAQQNLNERFTVGWVQDHWFDMGFCTETLEHLENPYNCLLELKRIVKLDGLIIITIPDYNTGTGEGHPYIYPTLFRREDFLMFLGQLSLPVIRETIHSKDHNQQVFVCKNRPFSEANWINWKRANIATEIAPHEMVNA